MYSSSDKIYLLQALQTRITQWRLKENKIVFTNGCFDLLHLGHIDYLERAAELGNKLIIGVNADESVKRLKGEDRPVMDEIGRSRILAALEFVDAVVVFSEDTPESLIEAICPDVLVKGADYKIEEVVGREFVEANGGEVKLLELVAGKSTTNLIKKIR